MERNLPVQYPTGTGSHTRHFLLDITESPREEGALFVVEMLERLEIQSSEDFRKEVLVNLTLVG
jgi:hypothetical protein